MSRSANSSDHSLIQTVRDALEKHDVSVGRGPLIIGVSGGVDSIVLLHALHALSIPLRASHINYQLRGGESDGDEELVRTYCQTLNVQLIVDHVDGFGLSASMQTSTQNAARQFRYKRFHEIAEECAAAYIAVAHHRDDQAETILMHLARGTGLAGAAGMAFRRRSVADQPIDVIRPLLYCSRDQIVTYAERHGLKWREDASNVSIKYTRARVRSELRPVFEHVLGDAAWEGLSSSAELLRELAEEGNVDLAPALLAGAAGSQKFSIDVLAGAPAGLRNRIVRECLRHWAKQLHPTRKVIAEVASLIDQQTGSEKVYGQTRIFRERNWLVFSEVVPSSPSFSTMLSPGTSVETPLGVIRFDELAETPHSLDILTPGASLIDLDSIGALQIRSWRDGDRMVPFGATGSRKISDLLTEAKVESAARSKHLVVVDHDDTIIWLVGIRAGGRGRVMPDTTRIGILSLLR
jgi:tRNA(Ile)-lysidine synthase